ncbi:site-2 protease family protein [Inconstantimicrobium porci]|uniref:Site-2 protease family protein n=1 Tax=Inconstantimicrobium porci TaxID=2652291 RepID=A0A7X2MVX7_9CLOT|nr:site-2 protease family protein [Inconstantimicrobium porci]MSR90081.1 site-2 protease family protein [Inconstantimicrobium porci]
MQLQYEILNILYTIPAILIAFTFHEYAHALVADKLGDKTPRFQGRLTLNPLAHIDPIGFVMILFVKFGWAKPVEVNKRAFKNYYKDDLKVSLAGPLANLLIALIFTIIEVFLLRFSFVMGSSTLFVVISCVVHYIAVINVNLFIFNLIPIPGLDGFAILEDVNPKVFYKWAEKIYNYQFIILIAFVLVGGKILSYPCHAIYVFLYRIASLIIF